MVGGNGWHPSLDAEFWVAIRLSVAIVIFSTKSHTLTWMFPDDIHARCWHGNLVLMYVWLCMWHNYQILNFAHSCTHKINCLVLRAFFGIFTKVCVAMICLLAVIWLQSSILLNISSTRNFTLLLIYTRYMKTRAYSFHHYHSVIV